jgi:glycosyltransferase involved in cell wall biosynthesis
MAKSTELDLNKLDLEKERKRLRSVLKTPEGLQALRDITGYNFVLAGEAKEQDKPVIAVLTPSRAGFHPQATGAFHQMLVYSQRFCVVAPEPAVSQSIVHWSRNGLIASLYKSGKPFDYILFMDDDMVPPQDAIEKLLAHKKPIVGAACTVRMDPPRPNFCIWSEETQEFTTAYEWSGEGLIPVASVGTGFMLIERSALETIADYYLNCKHEREYFGMPAKLAEKTSRRRFEALNESFNAWWFECLKQPMGGGEWGEDMSFCFKAKECGIPVFVDTTVKVGHLGSYAYSLEDYWDYQAGILKEETHKKMLGAAIGKAFPQPKIKQAKETTTKISVLVPTRGRAEMLGKSIGSLMDKASSFNLEILVRVDEDDTESKEAKFEISDPIIQVVTGPRHGYRQLQKYYNELAEKATGDWLMLWSDDAIMETEGWDEKIHQHGGGLRVLKPEMVNSPTPELNLFPVVSRKLYDLLGHLSLQAHGDSWLQAIARANGIEEPVDIKVKHLREDIEDLTKQTSLATYRESSPEFFSPEFQELLYQDVIKVKKALQSK